MKQFAILYEHETKGVSGANRFHVYSTDTSLTNSFRDNMASFARDEIMTVNGGRFEVVQGGRLGFLDYPSTPIVNSFVGALPLILSLFDHAGYQLDRVSSCSNGSSMYTRHYFSKETTS